MKKVLPAIILVVLLINICSCSRTDGVLPGESPAIPGNTLYPNPSPSNESPDPSADTPLTTNEPSPYPSQEASPSPANSPVPSQSDTPTQQPAVTPEPTASQTPVPSISPQPTASTAPSPSAEPTATVIPGQSQTIAPTPSPTPAPTPTPAPLQTETTAPSPSATPSETPAPTPSPSTAPVQEPEFTSVPGTPISIDYGNIKKGIIGILYGVNSNNRLKVRISLDGTTMTYDLLPGKVSYFPLQLGNGEYTFKIYQEVNNSGKFTTVHSEKINVFIPDELLIYKASIVNIYWTPEMAAIVFAYDRTDGTEYEWDMVKELYKYIVEKYRYDYEKLAKIQNLDPGYIPDVEIVFLDQKLICYDYSVLFASMLRSLEIPARLVTGYAAGMDGYHAWNEVYNPDTLRWVVMDLTHDAAFFEWGKSYEMEKDPDDYDIKYIY